MEVYGPYFRTIYLIVFNNPMREGTQKCFIAMKYCQIEVNDRLYRGKIFNSFTKTLYEITFIINFFKLTSSNGQEEVLSRIPVRLFEQ